MKKWMAVVLIAAFSMMVCACSENQTDEKEETSSVSSAAESTEESDKEEIKTTSSSLTSPLSLEEWGTAAKFSTKEQKYYNVPIRVISVTNGKNAEKEVKAFMDESEEYTYEKPEKNTEWISVEYELSLDGFPLDEEGADACVSAFVSAADGSVIEYKGKKFSSVTVNMVDGEYHFEGIVKGRTAFKMPENLSDYTVAFGEYGETQAYFSPNSKNMF